MMCIFVHTAVQQKKGMIAWECEEVKVGNGGHLPGRTGKCTKVCCNHGSLELGVVVEF